MFNFFYEILRGLLAFILIIAITAFLFIGTLIGISWYQHTHWDVAFKASMVKNCADNTEGVSSAQAVEFCTCMANTIEDRGVLNPDLGEAHLVRKFGYYLNSVEKIEDEMKCASSQKAIPQNEPYLSDPRPL